VPTELPGLSRLSAASAIILGELAAAAGVVVPPAAAQTLHPVVFACVDALATGDRPRATRLAADLWRAVSRPGAFAAGDSWLDEPVYLDGDPVTRDAARCALARDGVDPVGIGLYLSTAQPARQEELAGAVAFYRDDQPRDHGRFAPAGGAGVSAAERSALAAEPVAGGTWAAKAGARTVGEAKGMIGGLAKGRRVEHPNGSVGEVTRLRGKPAVKYPDQTVTLDQMGREVQHLAPSDKAPSPTPNPPKGWHPGDHQAVGGDTPMGKFGAKTVGQARARLAKLPDGARVVTPEGALAEVTSRSEAGERRVSLKPLGRPEIALDAIPADQVAAHRPVTKDPYQQKLKKDTPARKSLGVATAGEALHAIEMLPVGTRITDHASGKKGTRVQYPAGGNPKIRMMRAGIRYDGEESVTPLDAYTGDRVAGLEVHAEKLSPPEPERGPSGFVEVPRRGMIDRILDRAWDALKGGAHRLLHGGAKDQWDDPAAREAAIHRPHPPRPPQRATETT
jgi:hypothetical protein